MSYRIIHDKKSKAKEVLKEIARLRTKEDSSSKGDPWAEPRKIRNGIRKGQYEYACPPDHILKKLLSSYNLEVQEYKSTWFQNNSEENEFIITEKDVSLDTESRKIKNISKYNLNLIPSENNENLNSFFKAQVDDNGKIKIKGDDSIDYIIQIFWFIICFIKKFAK